VSLTYREQLLSPFWQRRRLEKLEAAGWSCEDCGSGDKTLHVHHRQYFKGRKPWEYDDSELVVLCDACHSNQHAALDVLKALLSVTRADTAAALIAGFHKASDYVDPGWVESGRQTDSLAFAAGYVAYLTHNLEIDDMLKVARFAASLAGPTAESRMQFEHSRGNTFGEGC
jgi:hypothetical protein